VPEEVWDVLHYADLYKRGLPLVAGGAIDQPRVFTEACRFIWAEESMWRRHLDPFAREDE